MASMGIGLGAVLSQRYRLEEKLGAGGLVVVYRARELLLDREVAVKVLAGPALSRRAQDQWLLEARAAARQNHPIMPPARQPPGWQR